MPAPGPSISSSADTQPGSDSLFPTGFGGSTAVVLSSTVESSLASSAAFTGTYTRLLTTDTVSTSASGTLAAWHLTPVDATSGSATWTLPAANSVVAGVEVAVKKADTSTNTVTVNRAGSDLIFGTGSGTTSKTLTLAGEAITFVSDGVSKWTIQTSDTPSGVLATTYGRLSDSLWPVDRTAKPTTSMIAQASQSGHGWTITNGTVNLNDTTATAGIGTQSIKLTTDGAGALCRVDKTSLTVDMTGKGPVVWMTVDDPTKVQNFLLYLGDSSFTNFYLWDVERSFDRLALAGTPVKVTMPFTAAAITGSPNRAALTRARFSVQDNSTGAVNVQFGGVGAQAETTAGSGGVAVFTFDDGYTSAATTGQQYLDKYAYPATYYPIVSSLGTTNYVSLAQLTALRDQGCEIGCHAYTGAYHDQAGGFTALTAAQLETEYQNMRKWSRDNGFAGMDHVAYPQGAHNVTVLGVTKRYFTTGRSTLGSIKETLPPADPYRVRICGLSSGTSLATAKIFADVAKASNSVVVFVGHKLSGSADSINWVTSDFQALVDYVNAQGLTVKTMGAALR